MYNIHVSVVNRLTPIAEVSVPSSKGILVELILYMNASLYFCSVFRMIGGATV